MHAGGVAPDYWRRDERFVKLVADVSAQGKLIATICHGPSLLISAKILRDRHVTCWVSIKDDVENAGCRYTDEVRKTVSGSMLLLKCQYVL